MKRGISMTKPTDTNKRRFLKNAVKAAYVAPLIMSLPAQASLSRNGSHPSRRHKPRHHRHGRDYGLF